VDGNAISDGNPLGTPSSGRTGSLRIAARALPGAVGLLVRDRARADGTLDVVSKDHTRQRDGALVDMILGNSVILVEQIESNVAAGQHRWGAVIDAANHRLRPILLTAAAAILGMLPIALEVFRGPMAFGDRRPRGGNDANAGLPALYVAWFKVKAPVEV
jgi:AcrB/AcrD/AcrF family